MQRLIYAMLDARPETTWMLGLWSPMAETSANTLNVLVVDDQAQVRRCLQDLLAALGHLVVTVPGPSEALASLEAGNVRFDCMITDVDLPIMTGALLAERASALQPALRVVMMSGHPRIDLEAEGLVRADQAFLPKPFRLAELKAVLDVIHQWRSIA